MLKIYVPKACGHMQEHNVTYEFLMDSKAFIKFKNEQKLKPCLSCDSASPIRRKLDIK